MVSHRVLAVDIYVAMARLFLCAPRVEHFALAVFSRGGALLTSSLRFIMDNSGGAWPPGAVRTGRPLRPEDRYDLLDRDPLWGARSLRPDRLVLSASSSLTASVTIFRA